MSLFVPYRTSFGDLVGTRQDLPIFSLIPNENQAPLLNSRAKERWIFAGNRSGKTEVHVVDCLADALGLHPTRPRFSWPYDILAEARGRARLGRFVAWSGAPDYLNNWRPVIWPKFQRYLRGLGAKWNESDRRLSFEWHVPVQHEDGSIENLEWAVDIYGKSYDSGREKWQSAGLAWIGFDEEPPKDVYQEGTIRVEGGLDLVILGTMTPVNGMTWVYDEIYEPFSMGTGPSWRECFTGTTFGNLEFLPKEEVSRLEERYPDGSHERTVRLHGGFLRRTGLVYPEFDVNVHVIDPRDPWGDGKGVWTLYRAIDIGIRNPTCCLWAAVNKDEEVLIYREYHEAERNLVDHAQAIQGLSGKEEYAWTVIDPSAAIRDMSTGTSRIDVFAMNGVPCIAGDNDRGKGFASVSEALRVDPVLGRPRLFITRDCENLIREMRKYRWADQTDRVKGKTNPKDDAQKVDDHGVDALRYLMMSTPTFYRPTEMPAEEYVGNRFTGY